MNTKAIIIICSTFLCEDDFPLLSSSIKSKCFWKLFFSPSLEIRNSSVFQLSFVNKRNQDDENENQIKIKM